MNIANQLLPPPSQKPPWPFWAVVIISYIFGPTAGFLIAWKNFQKLKQADFNRKYYLKIGGFFLVSFFLLFILSFANIISKNLLNEIVSYFYFPYWLSFLGGFLPGIIGLLLYLIITFLFNLPQLKQKLSNEQKCSASIILYGLLGLILSFLFMYPFSMIINIIPEKTKPQTTLVLPTLIPTIITSPIPTATQMPTLTPPPYYIKILDNKLSSEPNVETINKDLFDCQPELFDPKTTKFYKVKTGGSPKERYQIEGENSPTMMINGWNKEGDSKIDLPSPYKVTKYTFGCASTFSHVLDISKNTERLFLFTHVDSFSFSPDKKTLFLINSVKVNDGWKPKRRFVNLETKKETNLPFSDCSGTGYWENNNFLSYEHPAEYHYQDPIKVCVWDKNGNVSKQLSLVLDWTVGAGYYLNSQFGFLPNQQNVFYSTTIYNDKCILALQDINNQEKNKSFVLYDNIIHCSGTIEIDLKNLKLSSDKVNYRDLEDYEKNIWSPWKQAKSETSTTITPTVSDSSWKNYKNNVSNFVFEYPGNWSVDENIYKTGSQVSVRNFPDQCANCSDAEKHAYHEFNIEDVETLNEPEKYLSSKDYVIRKYQECEKEINEMQQKSQSQMPVTPGCTQKYIREASDIFVNSNLSMAEINFYYYSPDYGENYLSKKEYILLVGKKVFRVRLIFPTGINLNSSQNPLSKIIQSLKIY